MGENRVVVTGLGIISSVGKNVPDSWENVSNGVGGIGMITRFDASEYYSKIAGEVKNYDPLDYFDVKEVKKSDPYIQFALIAADEAVKDSGFNDFTGIDHTRCGVYIGSGIGGISTIESNKDLMNERGPSRVSPFFLTASIHLLSL